MIQKYVKRFIDDEGVMTTQANADMDLAIDALQQARNLDRVILLSGDGDFIRLVIALQNMGCRVEVIGFNNVSQELKEAADSYISGFLIPGLLPLSAEGSRRQRGTPAKYNQDRGFGFMRYHVLAEDGLQTETVFFHCSKSNVANDVVFLDPGNIFEFDILQNPENNNRTEAVDITLLDT